MNWGCLSKTCRKILPDGSAPASMRVTVLDRHPQLMSLVVNGTAVNQYNKLQNRIKRTMGDFFIYNWPFIFSGLAIIYLVFEFLKFEKEKSRGELNFDTRVAEVPLEMELSKYKISMTLKDVRRFYLYLTLMPVLFILTRLSLILSVSENSSASEIADKFFAIFYKEEFTLLEFMAFIILINLVPLLGYYSGKNERIVLNQQGITYTPVFNCKWLYDLGNGWSLTWSEIKSITLGRGFSRGRLTITPLNGRKRLLMPAAWNRPGAEKINKSRSLFSRFLHQRKMQTDFSYQINQMPLLSYIENHSQFNFKLSPETGLNFDLTSNTHTFKIILLIGLLICYALVDLIANQETYIDGYPLVWIYSAGIISSIITGVWLIKRSVPKFTAWGLALMLGFISSATMYPALLRLNQLTDVQGLSDYEYRKTDTNTFKSVSGLLPEVTMQATEYWNSVTYNESVMFSIRAGGLGFYQLDMAPVYSKMRIWNCLEHANGDQQKELDCKQLSN